MCIGSHHSILALMRQSRRPPSIWTATPVLQRIAIRGNDGLCMSSCLKASIKIFRLWLGLAEEIILFTEMVRTVIEHETDLILPHEVICLEAYAKMNCKYNFYITYRPRPNKPYHQTVPNFFSFAFVYVKEINGIVCLPSTTRKNWETEYQKLYKNCASPAMPRIDSMETLRATRRHMVPRLRKMATTRFSPKMNLMPHCLISLSVFLVKN